MSAPRNNQLANDRKRKELTQPPGGPQLPNEQNVRTGVTSTHNGVPTYFSDLVNLGFTSLPEKETDLVYNTKFELFVKDVFDYIPNNQPILIVSADDPDGKYEALKLKSQLERLKFNVTLIGEAKKLGSNFIQHLETKYAYFLVLITQGLANFFKSDEPLHNFLHLSSSAQNNVIPIQLKPIAFLDKESASTTFAYTKGCNFSKDTFFNNLLSLIETIHNLDKKIITEINKKLAAKFHACDSINNVKKEIFKRTYNDAFNKMRSETLKEEDSITQSVDVAVLSLLSNTTPASNTLPATTAMSPTKPVLSTTGLFSLRDEKSGNDDVNAIISRLRNSIGTLNAYLCKEQGTIQDVKYIDTVEICKFSNPGYGDAGRCFDLFVTKEADYYGLTDKLSTHINQLLQATGIKEAHVSYTSYKTPAHPSSISIDLRYANCLISALEKYRPSLLPTSQAKKLGSSM
jgi:hypothetical protein